MAFGVRGTWRQDRKMKIVGVFLCWVYVTLGRPEAGVQEAGSCI